jgi:hypothetical protein
MRICVSDSKDTNLQRLRSSAVWANRRIIDLNTTLEGNATEWFFYSKYIGIAKVVYKLTSYR